MQDEPLKAPDENVHIGRRYNVPYVHESTFAFDEAGRIEENINKSYRKHRRLSKLELSTVWDTISGQVGFYESTHTPFSKQLLYSLNTLQFILNFYH